jgi:hypothetical protein
MNRWYSCSHSRCGAFSAQHLLDQVQQFVDIEWLIQNRNAPGTNSFLLLVDALLCCGTEQDRNMFGWTIHLEFLQQEHAIVGITELRVQDDEVRPHMFDDLDVFKRYHGKLYLVPSLSFKKHAIEVQDGLIVIDDQNAGSQSRLVSKGISLISSYDENKRKALPIKVKLCCKYSISLLCWLDTMALVKGAEQVTRASLDTFSFRLVGFQVVSSSEWNML